MNESSNQPSPDAAPPPPEGGRPPDSPSRPSPPPAQRAREEGNRGRRRGGRKSRGRGPRGEPVEARPRAPAPASEGPAEAPAEPAPKVAFSTADGDWVAQAHGTSVSGRSRGVGAPLVLLTFAPADTPNEPSREILWVGRDPTTLHENQLVDLLERSKSYSDKGSRREIFPETVGKKQGTEGRRRPDGG